MPFTYINSAQNEIMIFSKAEQLQYSTLGSMQEHYKHIQNYNIFE